MLSPYLKGDAFCLNLHFSLSTNIMSNLDILPLLGWVIGDSPNSVFSVMPTDETFVGELKNTIKSTQKQHPKVQDIPASHLNLYSIYVTVDQVDQALKEIDLDKLVLLCPTHTLSQVFSNKYANNACYILVIVPVPVNPPKFIGMLVYIFLQSLC